MTSPPTEPVLARLADLHPTQITLALQEVAQKRLRLRARLRKAGEGHAPKLVAPVVFLRTRIHSHAVATVFDNALDHAMNLAGTQAAQHLPGWLDSSGTLPRPSASIASPYVRQ